MKIRQIVLNQTLSKPIDDEERDGSRVLKVQTRSEPECHGGREAYG